MNTPAFVSLLESRGCHPRKSAKGWTARCPAHDDRNPSLDITEAPDGKILLKCWPGCTVDAICRSLGLSTADLFPDGGKGPRMRSRRHLVKVSKTRCIPEPDPATLEDAPAGTQADWEALAELRNVLPEAVELAVKRGLVAFHEHRGRRAWFVGDGAGINTQVRRMDGQPWKEIGGKKAWTFKGSCAKWPVGIHEAQPFASIALVEGGPDLLAAHHFIVAEDRQQDAAAIAILGAANDIPDNALPLFAGKRIRIFGHADGEGQNAVKVWTKQLRTVGAKVDDFLFAGLRKADGSPIKDLNDCTFIHADDFENNRELWGMMP